MMKLSEVCKTVGVTRRTLQEYDRIGLLSPTSKDGYWLYDDDAVEKLIVIRVFVEIGYDRKTIKNILEQPEISLMEEFMKVLNLLEEKKKWINGKINWIKSMMLVEKSPKEVQAALDHINIWSMCDEKSFSEHIKETINLASEYDEEDLEETDPDTQFSIQVMVLACLKDEAPDSKIVRKIVRNLYSYLVETVRTDKWDSQMKATWDGIPASEKAKLVFEEIFDLLCEDEFCNIIRSNAGDSGLEFIKTAINAYIEYLKQKETKNNKEN